MANLTLDSTARQILEAIGTGQKITIRGFGTFERVETAARTGRNPQTGEAVQIPAGSKIRFKMAKTLRE